MAIWQICGFETGDVTDMTSIGGSGCSVQSSIVRSGGYAGRANQGSGTTGSFVIQGYTAAGVPGAVLASVQYYRFYMRVAARPSSSTALFAGLRQPSLGCRFYLTTTGTIQIRDAAGSVIKTTTVALANDTWYRLEFKLTKGNPGTIEYRIYADDDEAAALESSSANGNMTTSDYEGIQLGKADEAFSQNGAIDAYFDDFVGSTTGWVGPGRVGVRRAASAGNYSQWTGSFVDVDDPPGSIDNDSSYISNATNGQASTFGLQTFAAAGFNPATIHALKAMVYMRDEGAASALQVRLRSVTTDIDTTSQDPGASYIQRCLVRDTDPATSAAWTKSGAQSSEVGIENNANAASRATAVWQMVSYIDATGDPRRRWVSHY